MEPITPLPVDAPLESAAEVSTASGYIALIICILAWGSFASPMKAKVIRDLNVDPMVNQIYIGGTIFVSSFAVLLVTDFVWTPWGIATAALWSAANLLALVIIRLIGLSIGVGVWAAFSMGVSFLWGVIAFSDEKPINSIPMAFLSMFVLFSGAAGVSIAGTDIPERYYRRFRGDLAKKDDSIDAPPKARSPNADDGAAVPLDEIESADIDASQVQPEPKAETKQFMLGIFLCFLLGLFNGSTLVPLHYVPPEARGINFVMSFAIGIAVVTPVIAVAYFAWQKKWPEFRFGQVAKYAVSSGLMWNVGNITSIYATLILGQTIGFTLTQLALVPAGAWGILWFKEMSGLPKIGTFCVSTVVLLIGAFLLGTFA